MNKETKVTLEIFIHQIQEALEANPVPKKPYEVENAITKVINYWVKANKLHPEKIHTYPSMTITSNITSSNFYYPVQNYTIPI